MDNDDELNAELEEGRKAALSLARHLRAMRAGDATLPIYLDGTEYQVTVKVVGPTNKKNTVAGG